MGLVRVGVVLNLVGVAVAALTLPWGELIALAGLPIAGLGLLGAFWIAGGRVGRGAALVGLSGLALLPVGAVAALGAYRLYRFHRFGMHLGKAQRAEVARPRPRSWSQATLVFGLGALVALAYAVFTLRTQHLGELIAPTRVVAAALAGTLCGVEAALLWGNRPAALRLGMLLAGVGLAVLGLAGFYLYSYVAVSLLALPAYGGLLVWQGRRRYKGLVPRKASPLVVGR